MKMARKPINRKEKFIGAKIDADLKKQATAYCDKNNVKFSELLREALVEKLGKEK